MNFQINGINLNDQVQNQITFQPSINTVQEFKVDNQTMSAEYGRSSGAVVNIATRSGTNEFHGEAFEFYREQSLDARNFFNRDPQPQSPFKRHQFGANLGGPIVKNKTFFFFSYEGTRQRQQLDFNSGVLSDEQRAAVIDPVVLNLLPLIPTANDVARTGRRVSWAPAPPTWTSTSGPPTSPTSSARTTASTGTTRSSATSAASPTSRATRSRASATRGPPTGRS